ncbi:DMT family transporter [Paenactinomyces guangxiensis]|uniref:EamA family transporter n=1 Tax=Paenactinomyces guangxiensis TaxID=1490290 RepID=A0A7W2A8R4_9BACL|nr:EamA family transporter [Paenactinomyces guangxiensis]MBA4494900.1 EamA family transporter [Paenactinomyces guangxiensis]MBH8591983.1 EamA family transporter [Paenactinomyces guangxiensis]
MIYAYIFMCLIFGTTFLAIKVGIQSGAAPFMYAGVRFAAAGVMILLYLIIRKISFPKELKSYLNLAFTGLCMTAIPFGALYWGEQYVSSGMAALLTATGPFMITAIQSVNEKRLPHFVQFAGLCAGLIGVYLVVLPHLEAGFSSVGLKGALAIVGSEFAFALGTIRSRKLLARGMTPLMLNGFQMFFGSLGLILASLLFETNPFSLSGGSGLAIGSLLYLILFGSIVAQGIYYWLVQRTNPVFPATWLYLSPLIALLVGFLFLNERVHWLGITGSLLILAGVFLTNFKDWRKMLRLRQSERSSLAK